MAKSLIVAHVSIQFQTPSLFITSTTFETVLKHFPWD